MKTLLMCMLLTVTQMACQKKCDNLPEACADRPPTDEACQAYFERWFYNKNQNRCELQAYSGCAAYGFESKSECEDCKCR